MTQIQVNGCHGSVGKGKRFGEENSGNDSLESPMGLKLVTLTGITIKICIEKCILFITKQSKEEYVILLSP